MLNQFFGLKKTKREVKKTTRGEKFLVKPPFDSDLWHGRYIADDQRHTLTVTVEESSNPLCSNAYLSFSSREALYEFALYLLWQAVYTPENDNNFCCQREILSYDFNDGLGLRVVDGIRLAEDSSRLFIHAYDKLPD